MPCPPIVVWDPVPPESTFKAKAHGDEDKYDVFSTVSLNGENKPDITHDKFDPGPTSLDIDDRNQRWVLRPTITLTDTPSEAAVLEAWLEDQQGNVIVIAGQPARCEWKIDDPAASPLRIRIGITTPQDGV